MWEGQPQPGRPVPHTPRGLLCSLLLIIKSYLNKKTPCGAGLYAQEGGYARSLAIRRAIVKSGFKSTTTRDYW